MKKTVLAIIAAGTWMNLSEFVRNEWLLKQVWHDGFQHLGLVFPAAPLNGIMWVVWSFIFVTVLALLTPRLGVLLSALSCWVLGFGLLWIAMWNMGTLPAGLLQWAVPWSLVEVVVAAYLCMLIINVKKTG
ncbi:MAG: hypothetical protein HY940_08475 [Gammaproteobacteria bacterium]|nr:hypothetical protein [Gammaproteobacteria bacterium]